MPKKMSLHSRDLAQSWDKTTYSKCLFLWFWCHTWNFWLTHLLTCTIHVTDLCCNSEHNCLQSSMRINDRKSMMQDTHFNELRLCAIIDRCFTIQHERRHRIVRVIVWKTHRQIHLQRSTCCTDLTRSTFHIHLPTTQQTQHSIYKT